MPISVRFGGRSFIRPSVATIVNIESLNGLLFGDTGICIAIGEAVAGQPNASATAPTFHVFTNPRTMMDTLVDGRGAQAADLLFNPAKSGQTVGGIPIRGATKVVFIKTNQSTQATRTLVRGTASILQLKDRVWGAEGNFTWARLVAGTQSGKILTLGRDRKPNVGSQVSPEFGRPTTFTGWASTDGSPNTPSTGEVRDAWWAFQCTDAASTAATATFSPAAGTLTTAITGGTAANLNITLSSYKTLSDLIAFLNTQTGYRAVLLRPDRGSASPLTGDVSAPTANGVAAAVGILQTAVGNPFFAGMGSAFDMTKWVNDNSAYAEATQLTATTSPTGAGYSMPDDVAAATTKQYFSGGAFGAHATNTTLLADLQNALEAAKKVAGRRVVSLFDAAIGALTITSINNEFKTATDAVNDVKFPGEWQTFLALTTTTRAAAIAEAQRINNDFVTLCAGQQVKRVLLDGTEGFISEYGLGCIAAGIMAGTPMGTPLTFKYIDALDVKTTGYDPTKLDDIEELLKGGVLHLELVPGKGFRFADGISTYSALDNDAKRYLEIVEARLHLRASYRENLEDLFLGAKGKGSITTRAILDRILAVNRVLADSTNPDQILIDSADENGKALPAYRNFKATLSGSVVTVTGEVTFTQGIRFILTEVFATPPRAVIA